ncbi:MAG TPA: peptidase domain-containing ABC transporter [Candidatus Coprenecus merdigallinarum]|nr:peptidase domain-containing ABC transporter [Candidatus Coprenecus merdigallinarum]
MRKFPTYRQLDTMDCGPTCLRIIAAHYGRSWSLQTLRERCHISREGVSLLGISDAAEAVGFRTMGVKLTFAQLCEEAVLPCIVHWNQNHFVVVYHIERRRGKTWVHVSDPASGLLRYTREQFLKSWISIREDNAGDSDAEAEGLGIALLLEPTPRFYEEKGEEDRRLGFRGMAEYLRPYRQLIVQLLLAMLTGSIISLILPFLTQSVIDTGIGTGDLNFIVVILVAQVVLVLGQTANELIRSWLMLHMTTRVSISLISDFLAKLMRLPISFFDSRMTGDIMQRIGDHSRIQTFLTGSLLSIVMAAVTFVVYSAVMGGYDLRILGIFILGSVLYIGWVLLFLRRRRKLDYMRFQEAAANQSSIVQLIAGMQDIKLNGCGKQKRWEWERIQARLFNVSVKGLALGQTQQVGGTFIDQIKNVLISFLAAKAVIDGDMTLGMMTAMQYIIGQLNAPISQFISFVQEAQDAKISLERLGEIQERGDEESAEKDYIREIPRGADIEFRDVDFQYNGPHSEKVLDGVSVTIPHDRVTAIVGASGSGKTTMVKMMLGFYEPVSGEVLLGGRRIGDYSPTAWREQCGTVMQEGFIFSDTIADNIGVSDESPDMERVRQAVETANIGDFIDGLPLRYNTKIGAEGNGVSTGQKQRLLIARAAYRDARYLFLDEATNSLDANNEKVIMERLDTLFRGRTVVIVAHRLSTVRNADNIIVLDRGRVVEQGTHRELTERKGYYYRLVKNQLELGN